MKWTDGSSYVGEWVKGIQHGYGKIIFTDGIEKEGYFEDNVYIGPLPRPDYSKLTLDDLKQKRKIFKHFGLIIV